MPAIPPIVNLHAQMARATGPLMQGAKALNFAARQVPTQNGPAQGPIASMISSPQRTAYANVFRPLSNRTSRRSTTSDAEGEGKADSSSAKGAKRVEKVEEVSEQHERNPELDHEALLELQEKIRESENAEDVLNKTMEAFPDLYLADEALGFLIDEADADLAVKIKEARKNLNSDEDKALYIRASRNITPEARKAAKEGMGTPSILRALYVDIITNPRPAPILFQELSDNFEFQFLEPLIYYLLHSIGKDLKSKGPSIDPGELHTLYNECRSLQAIRQVYLYFNNCMTPIIKEFEQYGITMPELLTFMLLAREYIKLIQVKYPTKDKVFSMAPHLGIGDDLDGQSIIFNWLRIATYETAPRLFQTLRQREDVRKALRDAISKIDEILNADDIDNLDSPEK